MKRYIYSSYDLNQFNEDQQKQIKKGLESGVDVSVYADPEFDSVQMQDLREGLEEGLDVSAYANPKFDWFQMTEIRKGLESGVDVSVYADPNLGWNQMRKIRKDLESGADPAIALDSTFTNKKLVKMLSDAGIDTTKCKYELKAEFYERYENGRVYTKKFTCPGDWLAYFSMCFHKQPTAALVDEYFGGEDFEEEYIDRYPTVSAIANYASSRWWGDGSDYIIYLKNITTGQILYSSDEPDEEFEDDEWED